MRFGSSSREWLYREAQEQADEATWGLRWRWDWTASTWESDKLTAEGNACSTCGEDLGHHQHHDTHRCECVESAWRAAFQAYVDERKASVIMVEWGGSGIPDRYQEARFGNFERREGTEVAVSRAEAWADGFAREQGHPGLLLVGPFGSGKTHLAAAAAYRALERTLIRPRFTSSVGLIRETKGGEKLNHEPVQRAIGAELLVLDDIGQCGRTDFDRELLYQVIAERYDEGAPILATSNLPPDRIGDLIGGAVASRLYEACEVVFLTASDYRREKAKR